MRPGKDFRLRVAWRALVPSHNITVDVLRSRKPAKGQIICQRTDYLSFYRFINLLKDRLKL